MNPIKIQDIENPVIEHEGIYLVDKPQGWTSFDVVAKIRGAARKQLNNKKIKVGHSGTLDPLATGLLIILVGKEFTKQQDSFMKQDKVYETTAVFGKTSDTYDAEGTITDVSDKKVSKEDIEKILEQFRGEISQLPPAYSAIKINGQKAYDLARAGKEVDLKPRRITIYDLQITNYNWPEVSFRIHCSSGTYIRSLVHDIGQELGVGAYVLELRRISIGSVDL